MGKSAQKTITQDRVLHLLDLYILCGSFYKLWGPSIIHQYYLLDSLDVQVLKSALRNNDMYTAHNCLFIPTLNSSWSQAKQLTFSKQAMESVHFKHIGKTREDVYLRILSAWSLWFQEEISLKFTYSHKAEQGYVQTPLNVQIWLISFCKIPKGLLLRLSLSHQLHCISYNPFAIQWFLRSVGLENQWPKGVSLSEPMVRGQQTANMKQERGFCQFLTTITSN